MGNMCDPEKKKPESSFAKLPRYESDYPDQANYHTDKQQEPPQKSSNLKPDYATQQVDQNRKVSLEDFVMLGTVGKVDSP